MKKKRIYKRYRTRKKGGQHYYVGRKRTIKKGDVQTLIFPKSKYNRKQALAWAKKHGFKHYTSRQEGDSIRVRQFPAKDIKKVGGTFPIGNNVKGLYVQKRAYSNKPMWKRILDDPETRDLAVSKQQMIDLNKQQKAITKQLEPSREFWGFGDPKL